MQKTRDELILLAEYHESKARALLTSGPRSPEGYAEAADAITCAKFLREIAEKTPR